MNDEEGRDLAAKILTWFSQNRRPLPWRERYDPYEVWISEVMLQQTQMERGVTYFLRWMARFPDVAAVARASEEDILHAWEGLGYYRRARMLHAAAKAMMAQYGGRVPSEAIELEGLPGLGAYTVAAIRGIAFQQDVVTIDANVERVFARLLNVEQAPKKKAAAKLIRDAATRFLPSGQARDYNQALMEFGALVCGKVPQCEICPVCAHCVSRHLGVEKERPVREAKAAIIAVTAAHGLLMRDGAVLVSKRPEGGVWGGLWEFPGAHAHEGEDAKDATVRAFGVLGLRVAVGEELGRVRHAYTNHRLNALFYQVEMMAETPDFKNTPTTRWVTCDETARLAMPAHHRKLVERIKLAESVFSSRSKPESTM